MRQGLTDQLQKVLSFYKWIFKVFGHNCMFNNQIYTFEENQTPFWCYLIQIIQFRRSCSFKILKENLKKINFATMLLSFTKSTVFTYRLKSIQFMQNSESYYFSPIHCNICCFDKQILLL